MNSRPYQRPPRLDEPKNMLHDLVEVIKACRYHEYSVIEADKKIIARSLPLMDDNSKNRIKKKVNCLAKLSAKITLQQLDNALEALEAQNQSSRMTEQHLAPIKLVFKNHFDRIHGIKNVPFSYTNGPHVLVNLMLIELAKKIAELQGHQTPWLKMLIPSLADEVARKYSTPEFRFKNVVLAQDNQTILPVEIVKNQDLFDGLPPDDQQTLLSHSPEAKALVLSRSQSGEFPLRRPRQLMPPIVKSKSAPSAPMPIGKASSLQSDDGISRQDSLSFNVDLWLMDPGASPSVWADDESLQALQKHMHGDLEQVFLSKSDLCQFMCEHMEDRNDWIDLIDCLDQKQLKAWFLPQAGLMGRLFTPSSSLDNLRPEMEQLARWFCANAVYQKNRSATQAEYTGFFQAAAGSKTAKLKAAGFILDLIIRLGDFDHIYDELIKPENALVYQSLSSGTLGQINSTFLAFAKERHDIFIEAKKFTNN